MVIGGVSFSCWKTIAEPLIRFGQVMQPGDSSKHARSRLKYLVFCGMVPGLSPQKSYGNALPSNVDGHK